MPSDYSVSVLIGVLLGLSLLAGCARTEVVTEAPPSPSSAASTTAVSTPTSPPPTRAASWPPAPSGASRSTTAPLPSDPSGSPSSVTSNAPGNAGVPRRPGAVEPTLTLLARAASAKNQRGWTGQLSDQDPGFTSTATMIYRNLVALQPARLDFTATGLKRSVSASRQRVLGSASFAAQVLITWQLSGDRLASEHLVWMSFVPDGSSKSRWAGVTDGPSEADPSALPIWWLEPVTVSRSNGNVVLAGAGMSGSTWLARAKIATANVRSRLSRSSDGVPAPGRAWDGHLVLEIPTTQSQFEQIVGAAPGSDTQLAAVTFPDATDARIAPMRIMLNPEVMSVESELGIDIVLTHETTHVATRSPASPAPLWLVEGYADYNAYASYPQAQASARAELYRSVRNAGAPKTPPGNEQFSPQAKQLNLIYAQAWQLCVYLAAHGGQGKLNAFYASVDRSPDADVDGALHTVYGLGQSELMSRWDQALTEAAHG